MIEGILRFIFNTFFMIVFVSMSIGAYIGYSWGVASMQDQLVKSGYGVYIKTYSNNPDGSREVSYSFSLANQVPNGAEILKEDPSSWVPSFINESKTRFMEQYENNKEELKRKYEEQQRLKQQDQHS